MSTAGYSFWDLSETQFDHFSERLTSRGIEVVLEERKTVEDLINGGLRATGLSGFLRCDGARFHFSTEKYLKTRRNRGPEAWLCLNDLAKKENQPVRGKI